MSFDPVFLREARAFHDEMFVVNGLDASLFGDEMLRSMQAGGIDACLVSSGSSGRGPPGALAGGHHAFIAANAGALALATSVADLKRARANGQIGIVFGWQSADTIGHDPSTLVGYHQLGLRSCGLTYNVGNYIGSGCVDPDPGPLSRYGERVVETLQSLRMVVDIGGHGAEATAFDTLRVTTGPVVCSHTAVRALRSTPRAMTDVLFKAIADRGGVVGIAAFSFFLVEQGRGTVDDYVRHLDYAAKLVGPDHVGMGLDFIIGKGLRGPMTDTRTFPPEAYPQTYEGWIYPPELTDFSGVPLVTAGLLRRGYAPEDVEKIMGKNWLRVWQEVWGS